MPKDVWFVCLKYNKCHVLTSNKTKTKTFTVTIVIFIARIKPDKNPEIFNN